MTLDHFSFGTQDLEATRHFYEARLGFSVLIHKQLLMVEGEAAGAHVCRLRR